jgi:menaquinone-9 beta-reductase
VVFCDVLIVGSGPAGTATALHLLKTDPALAGEIFLLDKAIHPREKVCAGGLIPHTLHGLHELEIPLSVPHTRVERASVRVPPGRRVTRDDGDMCVVVRRNEFDHSLVQVARERGAQVREGEKVLELRREGERIVVGTEKETYYTRVVIGADGSGSRVRRQLVVADASEAIGRALMCDVPVADTCWDGFLQQRYDFNFLPVAEGLKGYMWEFPCVIGGVPHVNVGIYTAAGSLLSNADLHGLLADELCSLSLQPGMEGPKPQAPSPKFRAFPIYSYIPGKLLAAPHVVLVGDAAGAEPLMGEGISFALDYGKFAARAVLVALRTGCYDFSDYSATLARSRLGKKLTRLYWTARLCYGRPTWRACFAVALRSRRLQSVGLQWYNGVDGWDERSGWEALRTLLWPREQHE